MVNTELWRVCPEWFYYYNILNIVVNTEHRTLKHQKQTNYNILNIVVNTEHLSKYVVAGVNYNILNIVVNTERNFND